MKKLSIVSILTSALLLAACGKPNESSTSSTPSKNSEHCLEANACFMEVESQGKSSFYASEENYSALLTNPVLAEMNIDLRKVEDQSYASMLASSEAKIVYDLENPDQVNVYQNSNVRLAGLGRIFSRLMDALSAISSALTIGDIISGWINGGNVKAQVNYHFGSKVVKDEVVVTRD